MKRLLWLPILLFPVVALVWTQYLSWAAHNAEQAVATNLVAVGASESKLLALDHPALTKVTVDILGRYQTMNRSWQDVVHSYKTLALALSAMIIILAFTVGVIIRNKSPNNAFNSDAPDRRAG